ncbi:MAG: 4'-phosphopantetheinyl transferase superfamily protein [Bacteroidetes bacterium]|nr:4'-phosphopantetheinyl transferase superfamily protein [Bacteroidota bacterium]
MLHRIINTKESTIYVWHITETAAELATLLTPFKHLALKDMDHTMALKLWHNTHFLSTRILMFRYAGLTSAILKNEYGQPTSFEKKISITHSNHYTAIIVSKNFSVAIDLEKIDNRILRVAHKFVHEREMFFQEAENAIYTTLIWSAKETLYKLFSANEVIFKEELRIQPFEYDREGCFIGDIFKHPKILGVKIHYLTFENYVLTFCEQE